MSLKRPQLKIDVEESEEEPPKEVVWDLVRDDDNKVFTLSKPSNTLELGRANSKTKDSRCSSQQLELVYNKNDVTLILKGTNPSFLWRPKEGSVILSKGEKYKVQDGAVFTLFADKETFTVKKRFSKPDEIKRATLHDSDSDAAPKQSKPKSQSRISKTTSSWASFLGDSKDSKDSKGGLKRGSSKSSKPPAKKKKGNSSDESDGPNEYDLGDDFIDNTEVRSPNISGDSGSGSDEVDIRDVVKEGREFVKRRKT